MSYWSYYLLWLVLAYGLRQPWLLLGIALFVVSRRFIPDPRALWRGLGRKGALERQADLNPANVTAQRDLAQIFLDLRRPKKALACIERARLRAPEDAELLLLLGTALHQCGRHAEALEPLVRSVEISPGLGFGTPYLVAGDALLALRRWDEAIDAYERYGEKNSANIGVFRQLARAHLGEGDRA
jgi:tetratricopeptide (TPR) repeat protein